MPNHLPLTRILHHCYTIDISGGIAGLSWWKEEENLALNFLLFYSFPSNIKKVPQTVAVDVSL